MFPFLSRVLPWHLPGSLTRFRRIGDWLGLDLRDDIKGDHGLSSTQGTVMNMKGWVFMAILGA
jgi:hypothetical protein